MFNDDVLAKCPECGSSDTVMAAAAISCGTCGFRESFVIEDQAHDGMHRDLTKALNMAKARDVLQRWEFAG